MGVGGGWVRVCVCEREGVAGKYKRRLCVPSWRHTSLLLGATLDRPGTHNPSPPSTPSPPDCPTQPHTAPHSHTQPSHPMSHAGWGVSLSGCCCSAAMSSGTARHGREGHTARQPALDGAAAVCQVGLGLQLQVVTRGTCPGRQAHTGTCTTGPRWRPWPASPNTWASPIRS